MLTTLLFLGLTAASMLLLTSCQASEKSKTPKDLKPIPDKELNPKDIDDEIANQEDKVNLLSRELR